MQKIVGSAHQIKLGRGTHLFFQTGFNPEHCKLQESPEEMKTLEANIVAIKLCNEYGMDTYLDPSTITDLKRMIPVTVIMNRSEEPIQVDHNGGYDYNDIKEFKDDEGLKINS